MFRTGISVGDLNKMSTSTLVNHLDIEFLEIGDDYITARMPVDERHHQPYGILHGGASVALAETLGSVAAHISEKAENKLCTGIEINANHIKAVRSGFVIGKTTPIHVGRRTQVWEIRISNEQDELVCVSRLTVAVIEKI